MKRPFLSLSVFTAVLLLIWFVLYSMGADWLHAYGGYVILALYGLSLLIELALLRKGRRHQGYFYLYYLGATGLRLLLSIGLAAVFIFGLGCDSLHFLLNFFSLYLLYLGFEISSVLTNLQPRLQKG